MAISQTQSLGYSFEEETESEPWGCLCSTMTAYPVFELHQERTKFGRGLSRVESELTEPQISSVHAEIIRNLKYGVLNGDLSTNGTY